MATNLFDEYFNNPKKSYIYANLQCNSTSADEMSFDIRNSSGEITTNSDVIADIDLSGVHVPMREYESNMRVIDPNSFIYIRGFEGGSSYTSKSFGKLPIGMSEDENWIYDNALLFPIKYIDSIGGKKIAFIEAKGSYEDEITFIDACQAALDNLKLNIKVSIDGDYIKFDSTELGYDFWIDSIIICKSSEIIDHEYESSTVENRNNEFGFNDYWINNFDIPTDDTDFCTTTTVSILSQSQYRELYNRLARKFLYNSDSEAVTITGNFAVLYEDITKYVPAKKYKNGAMKGCALMVTYPEYNAESIYDYQKSLKIGVVNDRIKEYYDSKQPVPYATYVIKDVVDSYESSYDTDIFNKWRKEFSRTDISDNWIAPDEVPQMERKYIDWDTAVLPPQYEVTSIRNEAVLHPTIGLKGYCVYLSKHNLWENLGDVYIKTTAPDDESSTSSNLMRSFIVFNPNDFPVKIKYMIFG